MAEKGEGTGSRSLAFWSSLPGVLTGVAGVRRAATLGALFVGDDDAPTGVPAAAGAEPSSVPGPAALDDCFSEYFKGIPAGRLGTVEAGAYDDVLEANEPKAGPARDDAHRLRAAASSASASRTSRPNAHAR